MTGTQEAGGPPALNPSSARWLQTPDTHPGLQELLWASREGTRVR